MISTNTHELDTHMNFMTDGIVDGEFSLSSHSQCIDCMGMAIYIP